MIDEVLVGEYPLVSNNGTSINIYSSSLIPKFIDVEYEKLVPVINGHVWVKSVVKAEVYDVFKIGDNCFCHPETYKTIVMDQNT